MDYQLVPFDRADAATVLSWATTPQEREAWASITDPDPADSVFDRWHAEPGVRPFGFLEADRLVAYGEIWEDLEEHEAELARLIVDPAVRGRGIGRALVRLLADRASELGYGAIWARVVASNTAAMKAYSAAGFVRTTPEDESRFNELQPRAYVWMRAV